jgi:hypothetical protein
MVFEDIALGLDAGAGIRKTVTFDADVHRAR